MKYRAILTDPGNSTQEREVCIQSNSLNDIHIWAYGGTEGGMERPRGVLPGAHSPDAYVKVYEIREVEVGTWPKTALPAKPE